MGDDERFDYLYKFVSDKKLAHGNREPRKHNLTLLESGTLYVAKLGYTTAAEIDGTGKLPTDGAFNGTGEWIPLVKDSKSLVPGMTVERGAGVHPARRRQGRRDQDGPPRGRRAQPGRPARSTSR